MALYARAAFMSLISSLIFTIIVVASDPNPSFGREISPHRHVRREKLTHLHFYFHDIVSGRNMTAVRVTGDPTRSLVSFGSIFIADDPLTIEPDVSSKLVGRAQGMYGSASLAEVGLVMSMNFVFFEGKYAGSTLSLIGRNNVFAKVREMPIVGGSGMFRFARGYALARTYKLTPDHATVEYDIYVHHF